MSEQYYVTNKEILPHVISYHKIFLEYKKNKKLYEISKTGKVPSLKKFTQPQWPEVDDVLGQAIYDIANRLAKKSNFIGYTYREDFVSEAIITCLKYIGNFDHTKSNNPFAYITQICSNSFKNFIKKEKKHSEIKDVCYKNQDVINDNVYIKKGIDYTNIRSIQLQNKVYNS